MFELLLLLNGLFFGYYIGKGKITINRQPKMTDEQFKIIKELEEKRIDLETQIGFISNYDD